MIYLYNMEIKRENDRLMIQNKENQGNDLSAMMMDHLMPLSLADMERTTAERRTKIETYLESIALIMELGDLEHTSDWDPWITITTSTGNQFQLESHCTKPKMGNVYLEMELPNGEGGTYYADVAIDFINYIEINRA